MGARNGRLLASGASKNSGTPSNAVTPLPLPRFGLNSV
jgi:hypothetical protein